MTERLPALCRQMTARDRIALVLINKYRHLAGIELIRLIYLYNLSLSYISDQLTLIYNNNTFSFNFKSYLIVIKR
jgi:hypothetical protein